MSLVSAFVKVRSNVEDETTELSSELADQMRSGQIRSNDVKIVFDFTDHFSGPGDYKNRSLCVCVYVCVCVRPLPTRMRTFYELIELNSGLAPSAGGRQAFVVMIT